MLSNAWIILCDSAIYILAGFFLAGLLDMVISNDRVIQFLSGTRARSVLLATLLGIPIPLCSCSVLPTAITLRKKGASRGSTLAFLISAPETSVPSIMLTYALLGPLMAVVRPMAACITAVTAGLVQNSIDLATQPQTEVDQHVTHHGPSCEHGKATDQEKHCCSAPGTKPSRLAHAMRHAFVDLFDDIFGWIVLGILAAAAIETFLPVDLGDKVLGHPVLSMLLMVLIGVPLYVCAAGSTPFAAALILKGLNPGAALVFLLVGPATNIGALGVLARQFGRRTVIIYLLTIVIVAVLMGVLLNVVLKEATPHHSGHAMERSWLEITGAVVFLGLGLAGIMRTKIARSLLRAINA